MKKFWNGFKGVMYVWQMNIMLGISCWFVCEWVRWGIDDMELPAIIAGFAIIIATLVDLATCIETVVRFAKRVRAARLERTAERTANLVLMKLEEKVKNELEK